MIVRQLDDGIVIRRVLDDADEWRAPFTGAYQTVFEGPPYHERYSPTEAEGIYRKLTSTPKHITLLAVQGVSRVVGFGVAIPLEHKPPVAITLTGLVPIKHTMYLAELGVLDAYRGSGLGKVLVQERLNAMDRDAFSHVVLRVSAGENPSSTLYKQLGFEEMGVSTEVSSMRTDGTVRTDRRVFLSKVLSQVGI